MDYQILKTDGKNADFVKLTNMLDDDLNGRYAQKQEQYNKFNKLNGINNAVVIYSDTFPVACGAFKKYDDETVELKRIFVVKENRGQGLSKIIVNKLEEAARASGFRFAVLETGKKQPEAINLYKNAGYEIIQNYGQYAGNDNSICMRKNL